MGTEHGEKEGEKKRKNKKKGFGKRPLLSQENAIVENTRPIKGVLINKMLFSEGIPVLKDILWLRLSRLDRMHPLQISTRGIRVLPKRDTFQTQ